MGNKDRRLKTHANKSLEQHKDMWKECGGLKCSKKIIQFLHKSYHPPYLFEWTIDTFLNIGQSLHSMWLRHKFNLHRWRLMIRLSEQWKTLFNVLKKWSKIKSCHLPLFDHWPQLVCCHIHAMEVGQNITALNFLRYQLEFAECNLIVLQISKRHLEHSAFQSVRCNF